MFGFSPLFIHPFTSPVARLQIKPLCFCLTGQSGSSCPQTLAVENRFFSLLVPGFFGVCIMFHIHSLICIHTAKQLPLK